MKRIIFIMIAVVGCAVKNDGYSVLLGSNIAPSQAPTCTYTVPATAFLPFGMLDLAVARERCFIDDSVPCYLYNPQLTNQMESVSTNVVGFAQETQVQADANNFSLDGFYTTYEVRDTPPVTDPGEDGDDISGPKAFIGAGATVLVPGGTSAAGVDLLPESILQPLVKSKGNNFRVYVHVKGSGRTQDGRVLTTNEVVYMVDICTNCLVGCPANTATTTYTEDDTKVCIVGQDSASACDATVVTAP